MYRITENVKVTKSGCWVWKKSCAGSGYGQLTVGGVYWQSHRYAYTKTYGNIPAGLLIRHSCHNIKCCNPKHLSTGTDYDNYHDSEIAHEIGYKKLRKTWRVLGVRYKTIRDANQSTGISIGSLIKYTINGKFDVRAYRYGCVIANVTPAV